ncbi:MAG: histidinol-phosphate aminotransferase family protein [Deltaproteobacteria bacterium]|nr:histidinol-phosphate aminotransferase family protein [Deltaproteobacteria bacterium]
MSIRTSTPAVDRRHGGTGPEGLIDFSTSINPFGPPPEALAACRDAVAKISIYPPPYPHALEKRIAAWLGINSKCVLAGNGSVQLLYLLARTLKFRSPWVVIPTFSEVVNALIAAGSTPLALHTTGEQHFRLTPTDISEALQHSADAVLLGRPNSPTGHLLSFEETADIAALCQQRDAWCVIDEAFIEFADDPRSAVELISSFPKLLVLRSLTKIFAIPGLRIGYVIGLPQTVCVLRDAIEPWSVNAVAIDVSSACLNVSPDFINSTREMIRSQRGKIEQELGRSKCFQVFPSSANFVIFKALAESHAGHFGQYLRAQGILIRDLCTLPGCGRGYYRIGVRKSVDNTRLLTAAASF